MPVTAEERRKRKKQVAEARKLYAQHQRGGISGNTDYYVSVSPKNKVTKSPATSKKPSRPNSHIEDKSNTSSRKNSVKHDERSTSPLFKRKGSGKKKKEPTDSDEAPNKVMPSKRRVAPEIKTKKNQNLHRSPTTKAPSSKIAAGRGRVRKETAMSMIKKPKKGATQHEMQPSAFKGRKASSFDEYEIYRLGVEVSSAAERKIQNLFATDWIQTNFEVNKKCWIDLTDVFKAFVDDCKAKGVVPMGIDRLKAFFPVVFANVEVQTFDDGGEILVNVSSSKSSSSSSTQYIPVHEIRKPEIHREIRRYSSESFTQMMKNNHPESLRDNDDVHGESLVHFFPQVPPRPSLEKVEPRLYEVAEPLNPKRRQGKPSPMRNSTEVWDDDSDALKEARQKHTEKLRGFVETHGVSNGSTRQRSSSIGGLIVRKGNDGTSSSSSSNLTPSNLRTSRHVRQSSYSKLSSPNSTTGTPPQRKSVNQRSKIYYGISSMPPPVKVAASKQFAHVQSRIDSGMKRKPRLNIDELHSSSEDDDDETESEYSELEDLRKSHEDHHALENSQTAKRISKNKKEVTKKAAKTKKGKRSPGKRTKPKTQKKSSIENGCGKNSPNPSAMGMDFLEIPETLGSHVYTHIDEVDLTDDDAEELYENADDNEDFLRASRRRGSRHTLRTTLSGGTIRRKKENASRDLPTALSSFPRKENGLVDAREFTWSKDSISVEDFDQYLKPMKCLREDLETSGRVLGRGHFGCVVEGVLRIEGGHGGEDHIRVAVKQMLANDTEEADWEMRREAAIMLTLGDPPHPHILQILGVCYDPSQFYVIMELCLLGDLRKLLVSSRESSPFSPGDMLEFCSQIANGMSYLSINNIVHRDLAARNILVTSDLKMKISDYGLAREMEGNEYTITTMRELPFKWMAPECLDHQKFSTKSDVWSYGVTMFEIFSEGAIPYGTVPNKNIFLHIRAGHRLYKPLKASDEVYALMNDCWKFDPKDRISFREICLQVRTLQEDINDSPKKKKGMFAKLKRKLFRRRYIGRLSSQIQGHLLSCLREGLITSEQVNEISELVKTGAIDVADIPVVENIMISQDQPLPKDIEFLIDAIGFSDI